MNACYSTKLIRLAGLLLALALASPSALAEETAETPEPTTLVVTASDAGAELQQPASLEGSELIVRAAEDEFELATDEGAPHEPADDGATVVANRSPHTALLIVDDEAVVPAAATRRSRNTLRDDAPSWFGQGPRRPAAAAGIQQGGRGSRPASRPPADAPPRPQQARAVKPAQQPRRTPQPGPSRSAGRASGSTSANSAAQGSGPRPQAGTTEAGSAAELLVEAYELSLSASGEAEYSQIVRWCADAMRQGLNVENREFCLQLSAWALNRRGQIRAEQGQDSLALADFRAAIDFDPACWRALHNRGVTYAQAGQFAEAFDDVSKVIELNPQHAKAYSNRATLYVQAGDLEHAVADYEAALKLDPQLVPALLGHARVCHLTGRLEAALASFDAAIKLEDASAEILCSRADLLVDLGQYSDALQDYARAIDADAKFEHAYRNGAWLLATCPDEAIRDAEGALKGAQAALDCGYGERHAALDTMAAALANAGRFDEAISTIQQAIEVAPEDARAAYHARLQLYETRQPFRAQPVGGQGEVETAEFVEVDG